jgi:predicted HTH domain antitoxin
MKSTVELPDDVAQRPDPGRQALEALAIEGYRSGALTHYEASRLLQLSRFEFDALLKRGNIDDLACDVEDLEQDLETLERLEASGLMRRLRSSLSLIPLRSTI